MRTPLPALVFATTLLASSAPVAQACGDKLLVLGHGVKYNHFTPSYRPSIIAYVPDSVPQAAAVNDPQFQAELRKAGVNLRLVQQADVLTEALQSGKYDVILVDLQDAAMVDQQVKSAAVSTVVMPVVYKGADLNSAAAAPYRCVRKDPGKNGSCFSTIEKAIESKLKSDEKQRRVRN